MALFETGPRDDEMGEYKPLPNPVYILTVPRKRAPLQAPVAAGMTFYSLNGRSCRT